MITMQQILQFSDTMDKNGCMYFDSLANHQDVSVFDEMPYYGMQCIALNLMRVKKKERKKSGQGFTSSFRFPFACTWCFKRQETFTINRGTPDRHGIPKLPRY